MRGPIPRSRMKTNHKSLYAQKVYLFTRSRAHSAPTHAALFIHAPRNLYRAQPRKNATALRVHARMAVCVCVCTLERFRKSNWLPKLARALHDNYGHAERAQCVIHKWRTQLALIRKIIPKDTRAAAEKET